jgi:hypothetical protein
VVRMVVEVEIQCISRLHAIFPRGSRRAVPDGTTNGVSSVNVDRRKLNDSPLIDPVMCPDERDPQRRSL